jgi:hypothetical protein
VCVCWGAHARVTERFPSASIAYGRLAGVLHCVGVQREHRRVEHCGCVEHGRGMRRFGRTLDAAPPCLYICLCVSVFLRAYMPHISTRNFRLLSIGVDCVRSDSQAFQYASVFNANIAVWNVLSVTSVSSAFDSVPLADCIKRGVYDNWGSTLRTAYPNWSSSCATATPSSATPTTATPRSCVCACACLRARVRVCMRTVLADCIGGCAICLAGEARRSRARRRRTAAHQGIPSVLWLDDDRNGIWPA